MKLVRTPRCPWDTFLFGGLKHNILPDFKEEDGQLPTYENLVSKLNDAFRHQKEINHMNAKLMSVNYVVNLSNFARNRNLQQAVMKGRQQILELQSTVSSLEGSVETLNVEVEVQRKAAERLKSALDNTRSLLEATMLEVWFPTDLCGEFASSVLNMLRFSKYRQELGRQREMIRKQSSVIGVWAG